MSDSDIRVNKIKATICEVLYNIYKKDSSYSLEEENQALSELLTRNIRTQRQEQNKQ